MNKFEKIILICAVFFAFFACFNFVSPISAHASKSHPSSVVIKSKGWGMTSMNVFMTKKKATTYANKLEKRGTVSSQTEAML
ncbi:hypothetical protein [Lactiplantibacillus plantarum]|uniref:hypothetical protein n=1 Tax=Lactiplantibacillus plantarum TaxID=1590 RepID=UPI0005FC04B5|nr:hypothetical protein [Lactiplantibacillus plantarum]ALG25008.1 hypothetical protein AN634_02520 [Lactiplantibacillus plantarum]MBO2729608.1 hypothetical protein [Lactiplantibacillus plantarum]MCG0570362.1 hypothetical protein [Lactiplantibacillus plantarum]MCG0672438.1 hypothetical protein [Lactiplantibacillus plantarum]MCG0780717.1 hypothetical protein [Lactiplantibacillus plantarum]